MLVLSRKRGEKICIGPNITVTVVSADGHKVRLGIIAPDDVIVDREEIRIVRDRQEAYRREHQCETT